MSVITLTVVAARALRIAADATIANASTTATIRTLFPARRSNLPPISVIFLLIILTILKFGYGFPVHPRVFVLKQARLMPLGQAHLHLNPPKPSMPRRSSCQKHQGVEYDSQGQRLFEGMLLWKRLVLSLMASDTQLILLISQQCPHSPTILF